jgi:hypothetical protein
MKTPTNVLLAMSALGCVQAKDIVAWAVDSMVEGVDSESLRILAGFDERESIFELQDYFSKVKSELGLCEPPKDEAVRTYSLHLAKAILEPGSDYDRLVSKLYELCYTNDYPDYLMDWYLLDDGLSDIRAGQYPTCFEQLYKADAREVTIGIARTFINKNSEQDETQQPPLAALSSTSPVT